MDSNEFILTLVALTITFILLSAAVAVSFLIANRSKLKLEMRMQQMEKEHISELRETESVITENTMNNISRELHDNIGQMLTVLNFQLENKILDHPQISEGFTPLKSTLTEAIQQLRNLSRSLNGDFIKEQSLVSLVKLELERINLTKKLKVSFTHDNEKLELNNEQKVMAFRIFQEFTTNTLKYAGDAELKVDITGAKGFKMILEDNGSGFNLDEPSVKNGVLNMQQRANMGQLLFHFSSQINVGTRAELMKIDNQV